MRVTQICTLRKTKNKVQKFINLVINQVINSAPFIISLYYLINLIQAPSFHQELRREDREYIPFEDDQTLRRL